MVIYIKIQKPFIYVSLIRTLMSKVDRLREELREREAEFAISQKKDVARAIDRLHRRISNAQERESGSRVASAETVAELKKRESAGEKLEGLEAKQLAVAGKREKQALRLFDVPESRLSKGEQVRKQALLDTGQVQFVSTPSQDTRGGDPIQGLSASQRFLNAPQPHVGQFTAPVATITEKATGKVVQQGGFRFLPTGTAKTALDVGRETFLTGFLPVFGGKAKVRVGRKPEVGEVLTEVPSGLGTKVKDKFVGLPPVKLFLDTQKKVSESKFGMFIQKESKVFAMIAEEKTFPKYGKFIPRLISGELKFIGEEPLAGIPLAAASFAGGVGITKFATTAVRKVGVTIAGGGLTGLFAVGVGMNIAEEENIQKKFDIFTKAATEATIIGFGLKAGSRSFAKQSIVTTDKPIFTEVISESAPGKKVTLLESPPLKSFRNIMLKVTGKKALPDIAISKGEFTSAGQTFKLEAGTFKGDTSGILAGKGFDIKFNIMGKGAGRTATVQEFTKGGKPISFKRSFTLPETPPVIPDQPVAFGEVPKPVEFGFGKTAISNLIQVKLAKAVKFGREVSSDFFKRTTRFKRVEQLAGTKQIDRALSLQQTTITTGERGKTDFDTLFNFKEMEIISGKTLKFPPASKTFGFDTTITSGETSVIPVTTSVKQGVLGQKLIDFELIRIVEGSRTKGLFNLFGKPFQPKLPSKPLTVPEAFTPRGIRETVKSLSKDLPTVPEGKAPKTSVGEILLSKGKLKSDTKIQVTTAQPKLSTKVDTGFDMADVSNIFDTATATGLKTFGSLKSTTKGKSKAQITSVLQPIGKTKVSMSQVQIPQLGTRSRFSTVQIPRVETTFKQIQTTGLIQTPKIKVTSQIIKTQPFLTPSIVTTRVIPFPDIGIPPPPIIPPGGFPFLSLGGKGMKIGSLRRPKAKFQPSLVALTFNLRAVKAPSILTGLGVRPIIGKKKKKKAKRRRL